MRFIGRLAASGKIPPVPSVNNRHRFTSGRAALHAALAPTLCSTAMVRAHVANGDERLRAWALECLREQQVPEQTQTAEKVANAAKASVESQQSDQELQLNTGGFIIPHPQKIAKGGEDAFYIATNQRSFGVADGVGGWSESGIDPGNFARRLMREARKAAEGASLKSDGPLDSFQILCTALNNSRHIIGSSTACIICLNGDTMLASNIGDSGLLILRDGQMLAATPPQQHRFNFPYQIGSKGNPVTAAQTFVCKLKPGDIIVAGTDGLFDNVFSHRTARIVWDSKRQGVMPGVAAQQLATYAYQRAKDPTYLSPFSRAAARAGFGYRGGKVDDITVVVSYVTAKKSGEGEDEDDDGDSGASGSGDNHSKTSSVEGEAMTEVPTGSSTSCQSASMRGSPVDTLPAAASPEASPEPGSQKPTLGGVEIDAAPKESTSENSSSMGYSTGPGSYGVNGGVDGSKPQAQSSDSSSSKTVPPSIDVSPLAQAINKIQGRQQSKL